MKQIKTASEFFAENNGGKSPEECTNDGVTITPAWAVKLMQTYAQQFKPEWTAVEDGLPEENREVNIIINGNSLGTAIYEEMQNGEYGFVNARYDNFSSNDVTHWQPLPSLPNPKQ